MLKKFWYLFLVLLIEGSSLMAVELLGAKLLSLVGVIPSVKLLAQKKYVSLLFLILLFMSSNVWSATKTWVPTTGGVWTTAGNWSPSGAPATNDDVIINGDQSGNITTVPLISLTSLTINGTCDFEATTSGNTITITGTFTVASGKTFTMGTSGRLNFTLSATASGTVAGTVTHQSGTTARTFTNNGNLTISASGLINGAAAFTLGTGATLQIGSTAGITTTGATGNIQVTGTRIYSAGANYVYNGAANQNTGTGFPTNLTGKLTINNTGNTVTLVSSARTIANGGSIDLVAGIFAAATNLTMASTSTINRSEGSMTGTPQVAGVYNVNYTGNSKTTGTELAGSGLNNITVTLTSGQSLTLDVNRAPDGTVTINTGSTFDLSTFTLNRSAANGTLIVAGTLLLGGTTGGQTGSNFPTNFSTLTMTGGTVNYDNAAGGQTVYLTPTYATLTMGNTSSTNIAGGNITTATLNTTAGGTLNMVTYALSVTNVTNNGTIRTQNTSGAPISSGRTWGGTVTFNGSSAQTIPASTFNNLTLDNSAGASLGGAVNVNNTLILTSGILITSVTNLLSVTNTPSTAISGGSTTSFINGPVKWTLPASLGSGSTYNFPVGKGTTYLPFALVNPTTGTGAVTAQVEAFTAGTGGTYDATLASISTTEYWSLVTTGNFTNSSVSLTRQTAITPLDVIGGSTTLTGQYTTLAGTAGTYGVTGSNAIGTNRFFVLAGKKQTITTGTISGSPFCAGAAVSVPFTITGTFTSGNIFTAQLSDASGGFTSPVAIGSLTQTTAGTISGTIPAGTLIGAAYRIRVVSDNPIIIGTDNGSNLTVNPLPTATYTLSASPSTIYNGSSSTLSLSGSQTGINYQLRTGTTPVGSAVAGTGSAISFAAVSPSSTTTYNVLATNATTGCSVQQTSTATVTVIPACITGQPSNVTICSGAGTSFSVVASGSPSYQWQVSTDNGGSWNNIAAAGSEPVYAGWTTSTLSLTSTVPSNNAYQYRCVLSGGCTQTSNAATLTLQIIDISYTLSASPGLVDISGNSTLTLSGSQTGVNYQLRNGTTSIGSPVAGTGSSISFATVNPSVSTQYNVLATTSTGGCSAQITDTRTVIVNETGIIIDLTTCNGQPGLNFFTNSDFGTIYTNNYQTPDQALFPGVILGNPLGAYTNYTYGLVSNAIPDGNYIIANSTAGMYRTPQQVMGTDVWLYTEDRSSTPGTGDMYIVNASNTPGVFYTETLSDLCENTRYEFRAEMINLYDSILVPKGSGYLSYFPIDGQGYRYSILPNVDFMLDGKVALNTGNIMNDAAWKTFGFTFRTATGQTSVTLTMRNNSTGGIGNDIALDNIIMRACGPEISLIINTTMPVCPGVPVTMTADLIASDYLTPEYQWQKSTDNGVTWNDISGANDSTYTSTNPAYGDEFRFLVAETTASLDNPNCSVASNPVSITTTAGITGTTPGSVCGSGTVTLGATANPGSTIDWYANLTGGSSLGTGTSYTTPTIYSTTTYYVEATNAGCTSNPRTSVVATVNTPVTASVSISASTGNSICSGTNVTFTATPTNGGATPSYQWTLNGGNVGTNSPTYSNNTLANGNTINCIMTSSISSCITGSPATSNTITMIVGTSMPASVSISANPGNTICQGTSVTFTAVPTNGGATPNYQWKKNGTDISGAVSNIYTTSSLVQGDVITCVMTTSLACATGSPATSNSITMTVNSVPTTATISTTPLNYCGTLVSGALGGNTPVVGTGAWSQVSGPGTTTFSASTSGSSTATATAYGTYVYRWTISNGTCTPSTADVTVNYYATPTATISGTTTVCQNATSPNITFTNPQTLPVTITYNINGANQTTIDVGASTSATVAAPTTTAGVFAYNLVSVVYQTAPACSNTISGTATITVTPTVGTPVFTLGATSTRCQGAGTVTYTATATDNTGITYSLDVTSIAGGNSIVAGTGAVTYIAGWSGTSIITASAAGCNGPATATHTVTVTPTVGTPTAITVSAGTEPTCQLPNGTTTTTYATTATNNTGYNWSLSDVAAGLIGAASGVMTWANGFSGSVDIQVTANGCNGPSSQVIRTVTVTLTVGTPVFTLGATSTRCQGAGTVTYTATATDNTGITYSLDVTSIAGGNSIVAGTGAVTYLAGWSGTSIITASAAGCNGPATATHTVTVTPTVGTPVFTLGATSTRCQDAGTVTYTATATDNTGITYSLDVTSIAGGNSIVAGTGAVTYLAGWSGTSIITASAAGCNGPATSTHTVTVTATGIWLGTTNTDWNTASNWCGGVPTATTDVTIPSGGNQPVIGASGGLCRNITINTSASLTISGSNTLTVSGNFTNNGGAFSPGTGTVTFNSASNQAINGTAVNQTFYNVIVNKSSNTLSVSGSTTSLTVNDLTETSGNFTAPATLGINGNLTLTTGTFTAGSTTTIAGNWTNNGGTFTPNSGTINLNGSGSQTTGGTSSTTFNNLTLNNSAGALLAQSQTVNGTLTLTSGTMTVGAYTLTIAGNSPARTSGTINAGNSGANLAFTNSGAITLPASIFTGAVNNMTINGAGGVTAISDFTVNGILYLQSANPSSLKGSLDMGSSSILTMGSSATTTGQGDVTGIVKRTTFVAATSYTFGNQFTTTTFSSGGTMPSELSFKISLGTAPSWKTDAILRTYDIVRTGGSGNTVTLNLHYLDSELNANPEADLYFWDYQAGIPEIDAHEKTNGSTIDKWIGISNINISYFPTVFDDHIWTLSKEIYVVLEGSRGWRMISSPTATSYGDLLSGFITQGATGSTYPLNQPNCLWFDETDTLTTNMSWRTMGNLTNSITPGRGQFFYVFDSVSGAYNDTLPRKMSAGGNANYTSGTFSFDGGNQPVTFSPRAGGQINTGPGDTIFYDTNISDEGWNLLGNPTYSTLNWDAPTGWTKINLDNNIYIWDPGANSGNGEYKVWNGHDGSLDNGLIAPYQAFWVHASAAVPGLSFTNSVLTSGGTFHGGGSSVKSQQAGPNPSAINLRLNAGGLQSTAIISFMADAKVGPDTWDAYRLEPPSDSWLELFTLSSPSHTMPLVINNLPVDKPDFLDLPLFVGGQQHGQSLDGNYTLHWELPPDWPADWAISLHDNQREKAISMSRNQNYDFEFYSTKSSAATTDSISVPTLPVSIINPVSQKSTLKSTDQLPPFSIIIQKGTLDDDPVYVAPQAKLLQNYPNPFSNSTTLRFSLPLAANVTLEIFDLCGQKLEVVVANRYFEAGIHNMVWYNCGKKPGIYFVRMKTKETNEVIKLIIQT